MFSLRIFVLLLISFGGFNKISAQIVEIKEAFNPRNTPLTPDYSNQKSWASLPFIKDCADTVAGKGICVDLQQQAAADVFFVHPTTFTYKPDGKNKWNGDIFDARLNKKTDESTIRYQASVFIGAGKIYAPRYRQAHYYSFFTKDTAAARQALEIAYSDVRAAFIYYLNHYNAGRPIIIASHSQGTTHTKRLLKEFFDNQPLSKQLVCAYLVGMPVFDTLYTKIKPCDNASSTGCFCAWQTYAKGYYPKGYVAPVRLSVCTNPLTWTTSNEYADKSLNLGGVLKNMNELKPGICDAQVADGVVRIGRPHFRGSFFIRMKNYHVGDYNLFYRNVRENAIHRVNCYLHLKK